MKMFKKATALFMTLCMVFGVCSTVLNFVTFAESEQTLHYVSLGDSMTNGYGLEGYGFDGGSGVLKYGYESYANQFFKWLVYGDYPLDMNNSGWVSASRNWTKLGENTHAQLAMSGLRVEDLHWLLELDYNDQETIDLLADLVENGWDEEKWNSKFTTGDYWTLEEIVDHGRADATYDAIREKLIGAQGYVYPETLTLVNGVPADVNKDNRAEQIALVAKYYQESVANGDIISLAIGNGNFGVFMLGRIMDVVLGEGAGESVYDVESIYREIEDETLKTQIKDVVAKVIANLPADMLAATGDSADALVNVVEYTVVSYLFNYAGAVEAILQLNPDAEIIQIALMNAMADNEEVEGITAGKLLDAIFAPLNAYMAALPTFMQGVNNSVYEDATFYWAEAESVQCLVEVYDELKETEARERFFENITKINGSNAMIWPLLVGMGMATTDINYEDVTGYEKCFVQGGLQAWQGDIVSDGRNLEEVLKNIGIYQAFEDACIKAGKDGDPVTLDSFFSIGAILAQPEVAFGPIKAALNGVDPSQIPTVLSAALIESPELSPLLGLYSRCIMGNGLGGHPSAEGHNALAEAVIEAYENKYTAADKTIENVVYLVSEYYDDAYAFGYEYALENGYVDAVVDALDAAIAAVEAAELDTLGLTAELEAEVAAELAEVVEALEAAKALVVEADVLDEATLNALVAALEEANDALAQVNAVLAQAGADVNNLVILPAIEAAQEYVETVVIPAVEKAVDEAIEAAKEAAKIAAEKAYEYLVEALGDAYDYLVEAIVDAVVTYMPVVDEMLYDYFYNNPEEVIEFVKTYGPYLVPVVEEYGDEALALVGYVLYTYGEDMAAYVIENSDEILAGFEAWADKYGERTAEMLQVYAETLGLCDAVREQIAELEAALEELEAELEKVTGEAKAAIEAEIAKIEAAIEELNAKVEAVIDALNNAVADANAKVEDVIADIEAAIEDLKASVEELKAAVESLVNETLAAIREEIFAANRAVLEEVKAIAEAILNQQIENLEDLVEALEEAAVAAAKEIKAIIDELVYEATHGEYVIENDSFYVALGDSSAVSESYVDALAAALGVDYENLAQAGHTTADTLKLIAEKAELLAKADLVTVGYTANIFTAEVVNTINAVMSGEEVAEYDWAALVTEEGVEYVEKALAEVHAKFVEQGMDVDFQGRNLADTLTACVEAYAYKYVEHVLTYPELVNAIHNVAPEALVVIVGMHNTVENIVIDVEGNEIALGDYIQYTVDAANVLGLVNAMLVENTVFVDAPDVETLKEEKGDDLTYDMLAFVWEVLITEGADFATSEAGHAYIAEQILNALNVVDNRTGLLGDANSDGVVDSTDAMLVLQYDALIIGKEALNLVVCDVDGDGDVDSTDAMYILQYDGLLIEVFPVEE